MAAPAAELFVKLALDIAGFNSGLARATGMAEGFASRFRSMAGKLAGLASGGIAGAMVRGVVEARARLDDMSESTSLAVETLSSLERTAFVGGHSLEGVASGASKVARSVAEAVGGNEELIRSFGALGITQDQLRRQRFDETYVQVARAIATAENQQNAIAHATKIAGKAAADSIPFWKDLAETGLEQARITAQQAAEAERLEKETRRLILVYRDMKDELIGGAIPAMADWVEANREAIRIAGGVGNALRLFVFNMNAMTSEKPREQIERLTKTLENLGKLENESWFRTLFRSPKAIAERGVAGQLIADTQKQIEFLKVLEKMQTRANMRGSEFEGFEEAVERARKGLRGLDVAPPQSAENAAKLAKAVQALSDALGQPHVQAAEAAQQAAEELIYTWDRFGNRLALTRAEFEKLHSEEERVMRSFVESAEIAQQTAEDMVYTWDQAGNRIEMTRESYEELQSQAKRTSDVTRELGATFQFAFEDAIIEGKKFQDVLRAIAQDIARLILRMSVTRPAANAIANFLGPLFGGFSGGGPEELTIGARASGGPVTGGMPYVVGERGPELFVPDRPGTIVPNGGAPVNINVNLTSLDPRSAAQVIAANAGVIVDIYRRASHRRGMATQFG